MELKEVILIDADNELHQTVKGMISDDYKERFIAEYKQLCIRLDKLSNVLNQYHNNTLSFTLACPIPLLEIQADDMASYKVTLEERAEIEGINLD